MSMRIEEYYVHNPTGEEKLLEWGEKKQVKWI